MKKQFLLHTKGQEYDIEGDFYLLEDGHFQIELEMGGYRYSRTLMEMEQMVPKKYYQDIIEDIAWMKLEDFYTDIMLEITKDTDICVKLCPFSELCCQDNIIRFEVLDVKKMEQATK